MKRIPLCLHSLAALAFAITTLSSCVVYEDSGYPDGGSVYPAYRQTQYRDDRGYSRYEQNHRPFYDNRYRSGYSRYDRYDEHRGHGHPYDGHRYDRRSTYNHRHDDHKNESKRDDDLKHHPNSYRIASGSTGSKTKPKGYHSVSWYKSRGYDVNKLTLKNEQGQTYKKKKR